jgi:hypothetical protein
MGRWVPRTYGAAQAYTVMAPREAGIGAVAVWFDTRTGALFYPERRADPIVYRNMTLDDFRRVLELDFGIHTVDIRLD